MNIVEPKQMFVATLLDEQISRDLESVVDQC